MGISMFYGVYSLIFITVVLAFAGIGIWLVDTWDRWVRLKDEIRVYKEDNAR